MKVISTSTSSWSMWHPIPPSRFWFTDFPTDHRSLFSRILASCEFLNYISSNLSSYKCWLPLVYIHTQWQHHFVVVTVFLSTTLFGEELKKKYSEAFIAGLMHAILCPKRKKFTFSRAHSHALKNVTRHYKYFRGLSRLLPVPGDLVSFLELRFLGKNGPFGFERAPSASQKTLSK